MAKENSNTRSAVTGQFLTVRKGGGPRTSKIKFGSVTVSGAKPSREVVEINVQRSSEALKRVTKKLVTPGIALRSKKGVPQFSVAEGETGIFIRRLNGRVERGRLVDGVFRVID